MEDNQDPTPYVKIRSRLHKRDSFSTSDSEQYFGQKVANKAIKQKVTDKKY